jgi:hypothetical protein
MRTRLALALPVAFVLGCGSAPPPPAATPANEPAASASPSSPTSQPAPAAASTPPSPDAAKGGAGSASSPAPGKAAADAPILTGKITQDDILAAVNKNGELFNRCYTLGAGGTKKGYNAKVTVKATVSPTGAVNAAEIVTSTAKNPKVDACVSDAFKKLVFNRPAGSGATVFTFPLSFDGMEQVK